MSQGVMSSDLCPNYQLTADIQMAHKVAIHILMPVAPYGSHLRKTTTEEVISLQVATYIKT